MNEPTQSDEEKIKPRKPPVRRKSSAKPLVEVPIGYVAMHEVNAAMCLAGGILGPRFEAAATMDHHAAHRGLVVEASPSSSALSAAMGDLGYGEVLLFEVSCPLEQRNMQRSIPLIDVVRLIFRNQHSEELFRARISGFGDVPENFIQMAVIPELFSAPPTESKKDLLAVEPPSELVFESEILGEKVSIAGGEIRDMDRCAGAFLAGLSTAKGVTSSVAIIEELARFQLPPLGDSSNRQFALVLAKLVDASPDSSLYESIFESVASILCAGKMDDGFSASRLITLAEQECVFRVLPNSNQHKAVETFWTFAKDVLALRRDVPVGAWTDQGLSALARGTLFFLLNPEPDQLQAARLRTPNLGSRVHFIAGLLVGLRSGLTRMGKEVKSDRNAFFAGTAFVHSWFTKGSGALEYKQRWDPIEGARISSICFKDVALVEAVSPTVPELALLSKDLRDIGFSAHFLTESGGLSGSFGAEGKEAAYEIKPAIVPTYPRQVAQEASILVLLALSKRQAETLVHDIGANWMQNGLHAKVVDDALKRTYVRLSILILKNADDNARKDGIRALTSTSRNLYQESLVAFKPAIKHSKTPTLGGLDVGANGKRTTCAD